MNERLGLAATDRIRAATTSNLPYHSPATHGMLQIEIHKLDGVITHAAPVLGSMHRGAEKLFESRDYRQIMMLANRHEWLSAFSGELGVAQLLERAMGIEVPSAARWLRTLLLEVNRVTCHLAFLGGFPFRNDEFTQEIRMLRESWVRLVMEFTGSRMHPMLNRIGGLAAAPDSRWLTHVSELADWSGGQMSQLASGVTSAFVPFIGIGQISEQQARDGALSGPVARASGYPLDLRSGARELMYDEVDFAPLHTNTGGDVTSRMNQLWDEVCQSLELIRSILSRYTPADGDDINVLLPKVVRVPEGDYSHHLETPLGIASWYLVSRGDKMPYRLKLRPASLHTVLAIPAALTGQNVDDCDVIVASLPFVAGDVDR